MELLTESKILGFNSPAYCDAKLIFIDKDNIPMTEILITKILLAMKSDFFKKMFELPMYESLKNDYKIVVESEEESKIYISIIKSLYTNSIDCKDVEQLIKMLIVCDKIQSENMFDLCVKNIINNLNFNLAYKILDHINIFEKYESFKQLHQKCKSMVSHKFMDFDFEKEFLKDDFLKYEPKMLLTILSLDTLKALSENTIYCGIKRWCLESKNSPWNGIMWNKLNSKEINTIFSSKDPEELKYHNDLAIKILKEIKFISFDVNFLLDIVFRDNFLCIDSGDNCPKIIKNKLINEVLLFHASCNKRNAINEIQKKLYESSRTFNNNSKTKQETYIICEVSKLKEDEYTYSPSFFVDGYWFRLQAGKVIENKSENKDYHFGLFLSIDTEKSELDKNNFFIRTESQFYAINNKTGNYEPTHLPSFDTFTPGVCELGYFNVFKKDWKDFLNSYFVSNDMLQLKVHVKLLNSI